MCLSNKSYSLGLVRGLTGAEVAKLGRAGLDTTKELLHATPTRARELELAKKTGISHARIREAVNRANLIQVNGVGPATADLFENAGVNSAKELSLRNAANLHASLVKYVASNPELGYRAPSKELVAKLVTEAVALHQGGHAPAEHERFANDLRAELETFYREHAADIPDGANTLAEAKNAVDASMVGELIDGDPHGHDLGKYAVYSMRDPVNPGSDIMWYGAYERSTGALKEIYSFN